MANRSMVSPNRGQGGSQYAPVSLPRQASLYNRTFDEVHSQLGNTGKPLYSMNLDELLKNVISAESGHIVQNPSSSSSASSFLSNLNLNGTLSKKTIDEVWNDILHQEHVNRIDNHLQQSSLGETTLADFLVRAGAINIGNQDRIITDAQPLMAIDPMVLVSQQADWLPLQMQMQMPSVHDQQQQQIRGLCSHFSVSKSVSEICFSESPLGISLPMAAALDSQAAAVERKRRHSDEMLEKSIERRQKRMIKNRESAARSRARKQAHTDHLEEEKFRLQQTNSWLKKRKEIEAQFTKLIPKYQLRRTSSATF